MKINKLSVRNNTVRSIRTAGRRLESTAAALESPAELTPEDSTAAKTPFKNPNVLNVSGTTTTGAAVSKAASSVKQFHEDLAIAFLSARKPQPIEKQSREAYAALSGQHEAFLAWLPTSSQFESMRTPGGLKTLIQFFFNTESIPPDIPAPPLPKWSPEKPANCARCHGTGWAIVAGPRGNGVERCDCGIEVKSQWQGLQP